MSTGLSRRASTQALLPLTRQVLENFEFRGGPKSWTGPASRGDFETVAQHLAALQPFPREYCVAYEALTRLCIVVLGPRKMTRRLDRALRRA
jgi:predicted short-subunit dehydrogenase-like oxidoreductase (DUF2520 family)